MIKVALTEAGTGFETKALTEGGGIGETWEDAAAMAGTEVLLSSSEPIRMKSCKLALAFDISQYLRVLFK